MSSQTVVRDMFAVLHGQRTPVVTRWTYLPDDPFAVTFGIRTGGDRWVEWMLARDLLVAGLGAPAGVGDVRLRPDRVHDCDVLVVQISSPDGQATLEVDRDLLDHFVESTKEAVPLGSEATVVDMDAEIEKLTRTCAE